MYSFFRDLILVLLLQFFLYNWHNHIKEVETQFYRAVFRARYIMYVIGIYGNIVMLNTSRVKYRNILKNKRANAMIIFLR